MTFYIFHIFTLFITICGPKRPPPPLARITANQVEEGTSNEGQRVQRKI